MKRFTWLVVVDIDSRSVWLLPGHPKVEVTGYYSIFVLTLRIAGLFSSHSLNGAAQTFLISL